LPGGDQADAEDAAYEPVVQALKNM